MNQVGLVDVERLLAQLPGTAQSKRALITVRLPKKSSLPHTVEFEVAVATAAALLVREPSIRSPLQTQRFVLREFDFTKGQQLVIGREPRFRFERNVQRALENWAILDMDWPIEIVESCVLN